MRFGFDVLQAIYQHGLALSAVVVVWCTQMKITEKKDFLAGGYLHVL